MTAAAAVVNFMPMTLRESWTHRMIGIGRDHWGPWICGCLVCLCELCCGRPYSHIKAYMTSRCAVWWAELTHQVCHSQQSYLSCTFQEVSTRVGPTPFCPLSFSHSNTDPWAAQEVLCCLVFPPFSPFWGTYFLVSKCDFFFVHLHAQERTLSTVQHYFLTKMSFSFSLFYPWKTNLHNI